MFRPMRRNNQELKLDECINIIKKSPRGHLALLGDDDYPYVLPMNYVYYDDRIYFHGALAGHKVDSIDKHKKASFCIVDEGVRLENNWWLTFNSVICFGKIRTVKDTEKIRTILSFFGDKYFPDYVSTEDEIKKHIDYTLILELEIEHISGKVVNEK